ncbi:hypothetical protein IFT99_26040 [Pseudomonas sp. CFBP 8772]|nr:hypothetical protein [Pseudomonas sp. CFBP 8772]
MLLLSRLPYAFGERKHNDPREQQQVAYFDTYAPLATYEYNCALPLEQKIH